MDGENDREWLKNQKRMPPPNLNLVESKLNTAERNIYEELERVMFSDGTGDDEPNGTENLIAQAPATGTVHGLDRATYTWWRNQYAASTGNAALYLASDMRTALNDVTKYSRTEISDIALVTDQTSYELYEDVCMDIKILQNTMMADAGFETINFKGRPLMWCPSAPSGKMFFINPNYYNLYVDEDYFMEMTNWKEIVNQPFDKAAQIVCALNACTSRPIVNKVLYNIAA